MLAKVKNLCKILIILFVLCLTNKIIAQDDQMTDSSSNQQPTFSLRGYVKDLPSMEYNNITKNAGFNNVLQNRLNFAYKNNSLHLAFELRNRWLMGEMVSQHSELLTDLMKKDNGFINASFVPYSSDKMIWHLNPDRFFIDLQKNKWQVRLGRQRINWGVNLVSNPNDLFNTFSFFDFDYEERPGSDALRLQYYRNELSRIELAVAPQKEVKNSVAAMMFAFNKYACDFQIITGYYRHKTALGTAWAGNIKSSGFKGEMTLFNNIDHPDSMSFVASVCLDHLFSNGIYTFVEVLYNGGYQKGSNLLTLDQPMSADNIFISKYAVTTSLMYPISPVLNTSLTFLFMPDIKAFYLMPNIGFSLATNLDLALVAQYFYFNEDMLLKQLSVFLQTKWSF